MAAIIRLKRKACDEPAEGLVIALKKPKCEQDDTSKVIFKFAATLNDEKESIRDHVQAALSKEKKAKFSDWRDPKNIAVSESQIKNIREKVLAEFKTASEKKKFDFMNNRRLILSEEFQELEEQDSSQSPEIRKLFHLYDIIEENEDVKKQNEDTESTITCNDVPLVREKVNDYVIDIYYSEGQIDPTFIDRTVDVRPLSLNNEHEIYSGGSDSEELYEDEDDSNDENNWRNDYPEDDSHSENEDSNSENDKNSSGSESYDAEEYDKILCKNREEMTRAFQDMFCGDADDEYDEYDCVRKPRDYQWMSDDEQEEEDD